MPRNLGGEVQVELLDRRAALLRQTGATLSLPPLQLQADTSRLNDQQLLHIPANSVGHDIHWLGKLGDRGQGMPHLLLDTASPAFIELHFA